MAQQALETRIERHGVKNGLDLQCCDHSSVVARLSHTECPIVVANTG
jgi:hypothetical protein